MAVASGEKDSPLIQKLLNAAPSFGFFEAVRLIEMLHPQAARIGYQGPAAKECLRLRPSMTLGFPPAEIESIERVEKGVCDDGTEQARYRITQTFHGLYGCASPLPVAYTEDLIRDEEGDAPPFVREVLDIFHHRLLSLLYRVWSKYRVAAGLAQGNESYFSSRFMALLHLESGRFPGGHRVPPRRLLASAGLIAQQPHSAAAMVQLLQEHFPENEIELEPFVASWLPIHADQRCLLARRATTLGQDLNLGERILDRSCCFRLQLALREWDELLGFLPDGSRLARLRELVDFFNADHLDYEVVLGLDASAMRGTALGSTSARLGWSTWVLTPGRAGERPSSPVSVSFAFHEWSHDR